MPLQAVYYLNWRFRGELPLPVYDMPADEMDLVLAIAGDVETDYPIDR